MMIDYCPADGDVADDRVARALAQGAVDRTPAGCARRAAWVTGLATAPGEAELYAVAAIECYASIHRCDQAKVIAAELAVRRHTTAEAELARVVPGCSKI